MIHILNPFPDLLTYSLFAPTILRIIFGVYLIMFGYGKAMTKITDTGTVVLDNTKKPFPSPTALRILGVIELVVGICFILGLGVQIASIIAILIFLFGMILYDKFNPPKKLSRSILFLFLMIAVSLLLSGAGHLAIDLPL
jgi:uncharacterized membrane protein YphA (DoxX/SURF4 family)